MQENTKLPITNSFTKGINWDDHLSVGDNTSYRYAKNIIESDDMQTTFKSNEHSTRELLTYSGNILGKRYLAELNSFLLLVEGGEIHLFNPNTEEDKLVAKAEEFSCDWGLTGC